MTSGPGEARQRILKVLHRMDRPAGASRIGELLRGWGENLSDRSIRLHLFRLDREGCTRLVSRRSGRVLTERGRAEVAKADVLGRMGFISAQIDELNYRMGFSLRAGSGTLVVNTTVFPARLEARVQQVIRPVFAAGLGMGVKRRLLRSGEAGGPAETPAVPRGRIALVTVCSVSLNGILLKEGVPVTSRFGGLLEIRDRKPVRFVELLEYRGTTQDPLELFIRAKMTSVQPCAASGRGLVGASFREFPSVALPAVLKIRDRLRRLGLDGVVAIGVPNQPLYGIPVSEGRTALVVFGGLNPAAAIEEAGLSCENRSLSGLLEYMSFPDAG